jgi:class 3 adenylate cyclase/tetratricopeptide (TPR) repeat protein
MQQSQTFTRRLAAIAFADVAGWTRLVEKNDEQALRAWKTLRSDLIEPKIREHSGRLLEIAGDAVVVEFPSAVAAVEWALGLQRGLSAKASATPVPESVLVMRVGINVEDVIVDGEHLVGNGVNVASRIHQLAAPGEVVVTKAVRDYVWNKLPVRLDDLGERQLKNLGRPVRVFRVADERQAARPTSAAGVTPGPAGPRALLALGQANPSAASVQDAVHESGLQLEAARVLASSEQGMVLEYPSAQDAAAAAFAVQSACGTAAPGRGAQLRMALELHEPVAEGEASGAGRALRLSELAAPGEIVASAGVRDQLTPVLDADLEDLGECSLGQSERPVRAYRVAPPAPRPAFDPAVVATDLRPTVAVIPFTARSADPGQQVLGEVLAEEVILALSRTPDLNVISRLSTTAFRNRNATIEDLSAHLHATYIVSGAYQISGRQLLLIAELAEARSGRVVWASHLKGQVAAIASGKDELIHRIVSEVSAAVVARELQRVQSQALPTLESYTLLMSAITLMHRLSLRDFDRARQALQTLIDRAPHLAIPQAWMAKWHVLRVQQGWSSDTAQEGRLALACTRRALDADPDCTLALAIDGFAHTNLLKRLDVAQERYDHAIRVNPNDSLAWLLKGTLHAFRGEGGQAVRDTQRALRLSPLDPHRYFYDSLAATAQLAAGHYDRALELARRSLRANRTHTSTLRALAISQWQLGQREQARETIAELLRLEPALTVKGWLERSPSSAYRTGKLWSSVLREAGVPA